MLHTGITLYLIEVYNVHSKYVTICGCGQMPISQNRMISKKKLIALLHLRKPIVHSFEADQNETVLAFLREDEHLFN